MKNLHVDFTIEEYEILFQLLEEKVQLNDPDWNDKMDEAWVHFTESSLNAIESILNPTEHIYHASFVKKGRAQ